MARGEDTGSHPGRQVGHRNLLQRLADRASVPAARGVQRLVGAPEKSGLYVMNNYEAREEKQQEADRLAEENRPPTAEDYF